jgi:hypothetical protein
MGAKKERKERRWEKGAPCLISCWCYWEVCTITDEETSLEK